jgi:hypothetical protein
MTALLIGLAVVGVLDTLLRLPYLSNLSPLWTRLLTFALACIGLFWYSAIYVLAGVGIVVVLEMFFSLEPNKPVDSLDYRSDLQE